MKFEFFTNEITEVKKIVKDIFGVEDDIKDFSLQDNQKILLLKNENEIVGLSMITLINDPFKNTKTYFLDYICIKEEYQHQQLGRKMFEKIINLAKENNIDYIKLTSRKEREIARKMYLDYGMTIKDTDLFIKKI